MEKHFVVFSSPGSFMAEQTQKEIAAWDIETAKKMARGIKERHGALPYGFQFVTRERGEEDFDSKETKRSHMYYLGGRIWTLGELKARNDPKDSILISNMECNHWPRVIENNNSWKWTQPLQDLDVVLDFEV
ncbi:MAG: hypothetical protein WA003_15780 [Desulfuromonadaceae bacterium]